MNQYANTGKQAAKERIGIEALHPAWLELIRLCRDLRFGELEGIKIHDGLPVQIEVARQKVRLIPP